MDELLKNADPELMHAAVGLAVFALTHLAIQFNRKILRPTVKNKIYDSISNPIEHIISHATFAIAVAEVANTFLGYSLHSARSAGFIASLTKGFAQDIIVPTLTTDEKGLPQLPQTTQFAMDAAGAALSLFRP